MSHDTYKHHEYLNNELTWKKTRTAVAGQGSVNDNIDDYLIPSNHKWNGEYYNPEIFEIQKRMASQSFYPATSRAAKSILGTVNTSELDLEFLENRIKSNIDLSGNNTNLFLNNALESELTTGSDGVLIQFHGNVSSDTTISQLSRVSARPYLTHFKAENILDWDVSDNDDGIKNFTRLVLRYKDISDYNRNNINDNQEDWVIVLSLDEEGYYYQQRFKYSNYGQSSEALTAPQYPMIKGKRLRFLPFYRFNGSFGPKPSILEPIANLNFKHLNDRVIHQLSIYMERNPFFLIKDPNNKFPADWRHGQSVKVQDAEITIEALSLGSAASSITERLSDSTFEQMIDIAGLPRVGVKTDEDAETLNVKSQVRNAILSDYMQNWEQQLNKIFATLMYFEVTNNTNVEDLYSNMDFKFNPTFMNVSPEVINENINVTEQTV